MILLQSTTLDKIEKIIGILIEQSAHFGIALLKAIAIFIIGRLLIKLINKVVRKILSERDVAPSVRTFIGSLVNVSLVILLIISVIGALGVQTTSFAALLASVGVAVGMALSGNLSNLAGGLIILLFKPFRVGDFISTADVSGTVAEIQIFHTILTTADNIRVYVPNGSLSNAYVNNFNVDRRRVEWVVGIDYGEDFDKVRQVVLNILSEDARILPDPAPLVELTQLADSSVNVVIRVWVKASDYWGVYFSVNQAIYKGFNTEGINFPFPQLTIHKGA